MLYKVYPPTIRVEYKDGAVVEHRLVWQNVMSGDTEHIQGQALRLKAIRQARLKPLASSASGHEL